VKTRLILALAFFACDANGDGSTSGSTTSDGSTSEPPLGYDPNNNIAPCYQVGDGCNDNCHPRLVCVANEASWWAKVCAVPCNADGTCNEGTCDGGVCLDKQGLAAGHCDGGEKALSP
jgi:hypothetical protein